MLKQKVQSKRIGEPLKQYFTKEEHNRYFYLVQLENNIFNINNPWQGVFSPWPWAYAPKNKKYIKDFVDPAQDNPQKDFPEQSMHPIDAKYVDLSVNEFYEELDKEENDFGSN